MIDGEKKKIFISLPMRGRTLDEIRKERNELYEKYKDYYELINSLWTDEPPNPDNPLWYLGRSIQEMGNADFVVFSPNWSKAYGCQIEHVVCNLYGIPYIVASEASIDTPSQKAMQASIVDTLEILKRYEQNSSTIKSE